MFKVNDINKSNELNSSKTVKKSEGGDSFSSYLQKTSSGTSAQVSGTGNISITDAIFAAQMVGNEEERQMRRKMIKRGQQLIEKLEEIRDSLLVGHISKDRLIDISRMVKERSINTNDERLNEIMAEIELRVEVELAKLTK